jgi:drug/metabolite transporter (DMT)-like permease
VPLAAVLLAAGSALLWGTADFAGGKASQRFNAFAVALLSQVAGLPVLVLAIVVVGGRFPAAVDFAWAGAAGMTGLAGLALFYRVLASGAMAVVAPITGVTAASLPLAVGLAVDAAPPPLALLGAGLAVVSIALVSLGPRGDGGAVSWRVVALAMLAGGCFGLFFTLLAQTDPTTGMWPLVGTRIGSLALGGVLLAARAAVPRLDWAGWRWTVTAGAFDISANALFLAAAQDGPLSLVAPIASLYPATTVLLALAVERERVRTVQWAGLGLAAAALVLTAA